MTEITNSNEQLKCAARAAGYLGGYNDETGQCDWNGPGDGTDWDPREYIEDALPLISILALLVEVDHALGIAQAVISAEHRTDHVVMVEDLSAYAGNENAALMMAITRAASEIGRCMA